MHPTDPRRPIRRALAALLLTALLPATASADCQGMALHAHRGSPAAPENSQAAVRLAFEGAWDGAEIDIQQLRDQHWVLHHDPQLGRTTSLRGRSTRDLDSAVWGEVRLKDRQGRVSREAAPFLADLLGELPARPDKVLNVEIKQLNASCDAAQQAAAVLHAGRPDGNWFLTAIDRRQLQCVRRMDPRGYLGLIVLDPQALARESSRGRAMASRLAPPRLDRAWLQRLQQEVGGPVGVHVDTNTLAANPSLLADARALEMPVFTYHLGSDRLHADALRAEARRSGLLPSGAIIDGAPESFCNAIGKL